MQKKDLKDNIQKLYNEAFQDAVSAFNNKELEKSIHYCKFAAYLAWFFPFLPAFSDERLENHISKMASLFNLINYSPDIDKIVFYNSQIVDNGALTEQYLDFFIANKIKVLFIIPDIKNEKFGDKILKKIINAPNLTLFIASKKSEIDKIKDIRNKLADYRAQKYFLHIVPNDLVASIVFQNINGITTFFIVHNDHTFWLGKKYFDYYIEFRSFGISLAVERRGIAKDKILHIPYYPICDHTPFNGFPFDRTNKIVGISGANLYKYLIDPDLKYFSIIKELLLTHENFIFCLCGWGNDEPIKDFIKQNQLENRFYFLGKRYDFFNLVGNCDILFESYPLKGGLTPLYATEQKIPVVGITSYNNASGSLEELLDISGYIQPKNFNEFKTEANRLITDSNYRIWLGNHLSENKCQRVHFESSLKKIFDNNFKDLIVTKVLPLKLNDKEYLQEYIDNRSATTENILRMKLFILKSVLSFSARFRLLFPAIKASGTNGIFGVIRIITAIVIKK